MNSSAGGPTRRPIERVAESIEVVGGDRIDVIVESFSDTPRLEKSALVQILALDRDGRRVPIPSWKHRSDRVNEYAYLVPGTESDPSLTRLNVLVPEGAVLLSIIGMCWRKSVETHVVSPPLFHKRGSGVPPSVTAAGTRIVWPADDYAEDFEVPRGATHLSIDVLVEGPRPDGAKSPLAISYLGDDGRLLMGPESLAYSPKYGAYRYLEAPPGERRSVSIDIDLPDDVRQVRVVGVPWGERTALLVERPSLTFSGESLEQDLLRRLVHDADSSPLIVVDSTAPPLGKDSQRLRPNNLSYEFAAMGMRVLFIPFGSTQGGPGVVSDGLVQVDRELSSRIIELVAEAREGLENYYVCTSFPSLENLARAEYLNHLGWTSLYEVRDDMEEFNRVGYSKWYHPLLERKMLSVAAATVTVSQALTRKMLLLSGGGHSVCTIPNGVTQETVDGSAELRSVHHLAQRNDSIIVGYVGHLTPSWFDWPLVLRFAEEHPEIRFEIIGHGKPEEVELPRNVEFLGAKTHQEITPIASRWKVGVIPFLQSPLTRGVDPNKIYEYFAWGLRVVSAPMGSVHEYPSTWVYRSATEFEEAIMEAVTTEMSHRELEALSAFVEESLWSDRAKAMLEMMEGARR